MPLQPKQFIHVYKRLPTRSMGGFSRARHKPSLEDVYESYSYVNFDKNETSKSHRKSTEEEFPPLVQKNRTKRQNKVSDATITTTKNRKPEANTTNKKKTVGTVSVSPVKKKKVMGDNQSEREDTDEEMTDSSEEEEDSEEDEEEEEDESTDLEDSDEEDDDSKDDEMEEKGRRLLVGRGKRNKGRPRGGKKGKVSGSATKRRSKTSGKKRKGQSRKGKVRRGFAKKYRDKFASDFFSHI